MSVLDTSSSDPSPAAPTGGGDLLTRLAALEQRVAELEQQRHDAAADGAPDVWMSEDCCSLRLHGRWFYFSGGEQRRVAEILVSALIRWPGRGLPREFFVDPLNIEWRIQHVFRGRARALFTSGMLISPAPGLWCLSPTPPATLQRMRNGCATENRQSKANVRVCR